LSALAVTIALEILKLKVIPLSFANKYPVPTNIALSAVASGIVVWHSSLPPMDWTGWLLLVGLIATVAAMVYNVLIKNWDQVRNLEGGGQ